MWRISIPGSVNSIQCCFRMCFLPCNSFVRPVISWWFVLGTLRILSERRLAQTGIKPYFRVWVGTDLALGLSKGETHFHILRERLALSQEEFQRNSMSVGDAQHDIQVAKSAGILSVGRVNSFNRASLREACPDFLISDFYELVQLLTNPTGTENEFISVACLHNRNHPAPVSRSS